MLDALQRPVHVGLTRTVNATVEPITLAEAKTWLHVDDAHEDALVEQLIQAARQKVEDDTGLGLLTQTWTLSLDTLPAPQRIVLPVNPVQSVSSIKSYAVDDTEATVSTSVYRLDRASLPARIVLKDGQSWPTTGRPQNGLLVTFVAGYGSTPEDVPMPLRHAMQLLIRHWFDQRTPVVVGASVSDVPLAYDALVRPYRVEVIW